METMGAISVSLSHPLGQLYMRNCERCCGRYSGEKNTSPAPWKQTFHSIPWVSDVLFLLIEAPTGAVSTPSLHS